MWDSLKEVWPKTFLTTTVLLIAYGLFCGVRVLLIAYGLFCGVRMIIKDEKKRRRDTANYITGQVINVDGGMVM